MAAEHQNGIDLTPLGQYSLGGSPKQMYTYFLLSLMRDFFTGIKVNDSDQVENCIMALVACIPDSREQERLSSFYFNKLKEDKPVRQAAILTLGQVTIFLNGTLEFSESAAGALM
jgi:hypothetical protein